MLICLLLLASISKAQVMTLDECVKMAMMSNKQIQATDHMVSQYKHTHKSVYANYFPNISLNASDVYSTHNANAIMDIATRATDTTHISTFSERCSAQTDFK